MHPDEYAALGWFAQRRPSNLTRVWRWFGWEWARLGEVRASERAHAIADWYAQPIWKQILTQDAIRDLERRAVREAHKKRHAAP